MCLIEFVHMTTISPRSHLRFRVATHSACIQQSCAVQPHITRSDHKPRLASNITTGFPSTSTAPVEALQECCPYCKCVLPTAFDYDPFNDSGGGRIHMHDEDEEEDGIKSLSSNAAYTSCVTLDYFQPLEMANESSSRPSSRPRSTLLVAGASSSTNNMR